MITRLEIDGFKSFEKFSIDFTPFSAVVGPNASGKSNLFDAIQLISHLVELDVRSALLGLRGEPEELFRKTPDGQCNTMSFAVELLLPPSGTDPFGVEFEVKARRLRYEITLEMRIGKDGGTSGIFVSREQCLRIKKSEDRSEFVRRINNKLGYGGNIGDFLLTETDDNGAPIFKMRQDGGSGKPRIIPARDASKSAISTIPNAEFPHLWAVRSFLSGINFLEINARSARSENDRFEQQTMRPDASNLSAVLARIKDETSSEIRPDGVLNDISQGLSRLIPSVKKVISITSADKKEYSFEVKMADGEQFSSRVISDGTLRLLALITFLYDPKRSGLLCFEEPENGVHEGRISALVETLREASEFDLEDCLQIIINTHSPAVMRYLNDTEVIAADIVSRTRGTTTRKSTRMRRGVTSQVDMFNSDHHLTRFEIETLLRSAGGSV
ncbi:AAA family ATPase [Cereibacter johrii]|uniref:ATPase n=1 Tax=Cereibacter johrii TaxID=445629 RepID=A0ABX5J434_9RHOB|nr:AAA family ATPase [Cereibacter johrii]PTM75890.1 putative ATPase [Cereibacter johrii]